MQHFRWCTCLTPLCLPALQHRCGSMPSGPFRFCAIRKPRASRLWTWCWLTTGWRGLLQLVLVLVQSSTLCVCRRLLLRLIAKCSSLALRPCPTTCARGPTRASLSPSQSPTQTLTATTSMCQLCTLVTLSSQESPRVGGASGPVDCPTDVSG